MTGKKIVGTKTGFFKLDVPDDIVSVTHDYHWRTFERMLVDSLAEENSDDAINWVKENASLELFSKKWRRLLMNMGMDLDD